MPASTAPLQSLSSKLVKSRHCLHAANLQVEAGRAESDSSRQQVESNDVLITSLEAQERKLKLEYVEAKLAYEKMHALKYAKAQELKLARSHKTAAAKEGDSVAGAQHARRYEWTKAHEAHIKAEDTAKGIAAKLEAVEKDKEVQRRRVDVARSEITKFSRMHDALKRELDVIQASAAAV